MKTSRKDYAPVKTGVLTGAILIGLAILLYVIFKIRGVFPPIFYGMLIGYLLLPITNFFSKKIPRFFASLLTIALFLSVLILMGYLLIPKIITEASEVTANLPAIINSISLFFENLINKLPLNLRGTLLKSFLDNVDNLFRTNISLLEKTFFTALMQKITLVPSFFISTVLAFFFMKDSAMLFNVSSKLFKEDNNKSWIKFLKESNEEIRTYYSTLLIIAICTGTLIGTMSYFIGLKYFLLIGFMDSFLELLPYVGPTIVYIIGATFAALTSLKAFLLFSVFFITIEIIQSQIVIPHFAGKRIRIPPIAIILIIIIGGSLAGVLGIIIAVPSFLVIRNIIKTLYPAFYQTIKAA
jgi:predicted PurR-regulated permease PerM